MSSSEMSDEEFSELLVLCQEIAGAYPEGIIFIGGIAVYLHAMNCRETESLAETTHDADFYISLTDLGDLRDAEEITSNRRLNKYQLRKGGFEFDIYTERHSALLVPYDQVAAHAIQFDTLRVASLEHLVVLKLEAYRDRHASAKGQKDAADLIRIGLVAASSGDLIDAKVCEPYLGDEHLRLLEQVKRGPEFLALARGNAKQAKELRQKFAEGIAGFGLK